eukprot:TRINITY_DN72426_c0_g1_i1.p1 TRINITY_DN72426_c0_g1~~TRINITY_DN72426_c0_g1_i1.p1  ORF type:complete len:847 (+),score=189.71 TRINITY_DN72426_c0_g1_i1:29-2569(+)
MASQQVSAAVWPSHWQLGSSWAQAPRSGNSRRVVDEVKARSRRARNCCRPSDCWLRGVLAASAASVGGATASRSRPAQRSVARAAYDVADEDQELAESLKERTLESLDFDFVLQKLQALCYTKQAAEIAMKPAELMAGSAEEARELYAAVLELTLLEDADLNLVAKLDIDQEVDSCSRGAVLDPPQLQKISDSIEALLRLRNGLEAAGARGVQIPVLLGYCEQIELADELLDALLEAFEEDGDLSEDKFPELRSLRDEVKQLTGACTDAIRKVLSSGKYAGYLSDDGYIQVGGHYCLSVKPNFKRQVGQVIDESRTGRTVYVEPTELIGPAAALIEKQQELKFTIRRILAAMSVAVSKSAQTIRTSLWAAAQIDLTRARLFLGEDMEGEIPDVQDEGIIRCRLARNPCLLLRGAGTRVVGYRLELGLSSQALILSGPNAGGKTVVLKTVGLLALLARCGIPVPGGEDPRVDFFEAVLAEVGDMQTIVDDLSTYSAHLVASRIMLSVAKQSGPKSLVLVDEAGTGTDPQQGAALARAILEALLQYGARAVATTHSMQLKNWATEDPRTETAAMEYKQGQPTFRLARNAVGESHAIETAQRLRLPAALVKRAEELLTDDQQQLLALQRQAALAEKEFIEATGKAEEREAEATALMEALVDKEREFVLQRERLSSMEVDLRAKEERMRSQMQAELKAKVDAKERQLKDLVRRLKHESANLGPGDRLRIVGDALEDIRIEREQAAAELNQRATPQLPGALGPKEQLKIGDWVVILARTPWYGFKGCVQDVRDEKVVLILEGKSGRLETTKTEVGRTTAPLPKTPTRNGTLKRETKNEQKNGTRDYSKMTW